MLTRKNIDELIIDTILKILKGRQEVPENTFKRLSNEYGNSIEKISALASPLILEWRNENIKKELIEDIECEIESKPYLTNKIYAELSEKYNCTLEYVKSIFLSQNEEIITAEINDLLSRDDIILYNISEALSEKYNCSIEYIQNIIERQIARRNSLQVKKNIEKEVQILLDSNKQFNDDKVNLIAHKYHRSEKTVNKIYRMRLRIKIIEEVQQVLNEKKIVPEDAFEQIAQKYGCKVENVQEFSTHHIKEWRRNNIEEKVKKEIINHFNSKGELTRNDIDGLRISFLSPKAYIMNIYKPLLNEYKSNLDKEIKNEINAILEKRQEIPEKLFFALSKKFKCSNEYIQELTINQIAEWRKINIEGQLKFDINEVVQRFGQISENAYEELIEKYHCSDTYFEQLYMPIIKNSIVEEMMNILENKFEIPEHSYRNLSRKYHCSIKEIKKYIEPLISGWRERNIEQKILNELESFKQSSISDNKVIKLNLSEKYKCPETYIEQITDNLDSGHLIHQAKTDRFDNNLYNTLSDLIKSIVEKWPMDDDTKNKLKNLCKCDEPTLKNYSVLILLDYLTGLWPWPIDVDVEIKKDFNIADKNIPLLLVDIINRIDKKRMNYVMHEIKLELPNNWLNVKLDITTMSRKMNYHTIIIGQVLKRLKLKYKK